MPELPEVETVVRGLRASLPGRAIVGLRLGKTDFIDDPVSLERDVPGCRIAAVDRWGKFIAISLAHGGRDDGGLLLLVHLGMTGQLVVCAPNLPVAPHTHVFFTFDDGTELRYADPRRFGRIALLPAAQQEEFRKRLGREPLEISQGELRTLLEGRRAMIKALLLNQSFLRGMGNIYTDESLWRAKIHPAKHAAKLTPGEVAKLHAAMRHILNEAIRLRGSSISDYVDANGERGEFQFRHRVYGREGKKCSRCSTTIRRVIVAGRSSYFCPRCQPAPRRRRTWRK